MHIIFPIHLSYLSVFLVSSYTSVLLPFVFGLVLFVFFILPSFALLRGLRVSALRLNALDLPSCSVATVVVKALAFDFALDFQHNCFVVMNLVFLFSVLSVARRLKLFAFGLPS